MLQTKRRQAHYRGCFVADVFHVGVIARLQQRESSIYGRVSNVGHLRRSVGNSIEQHAQINARATIF